MKKKLLLFTCLILSATLLSGCGSSVKKTRTTTRPASVTAAPVTPSPTPVPTAAPAPTPEPTPIVVPISTPVPTPSFTFPPAPVTTYAPTPMQTGLPRVTKDPTDEIVPVNGECMFIARYENADLAEWHFVSPDGSLDVSYAVVQSYFPELRIIGGSSKDLTLQNIPEALNGCHVYCCFTNSAGSVNTGSALITVKSLPASGYITPGYSTPSMQRTGFEGLWADVTGRCQATFAYRGDSSMNVSINRYDSTWGHACWQMTASVYRNNVMVYSDGHSWVENYYNDSIFSVSDDKYGGSGSFCLLDGNLHWYNDQTGEETVFVPA